MKNSIRTYLLPTCLTIAVVVLCSCGKDTQDKVSHTPSKKHYGGTYRMNILRGSPNALDPVLINSKHADDIATQVYDRLLDLDSSLTLVPELAKSMPTISADGKLYHFDLRTDVFFHDDACFPNGKGRKLTASDVKYSFERCCDPRTRTVAFWAFQNKVKGATEYFESINKKSPLSDVTGFKVLNDSTFEIELIEPYAPFIYYLVNSLGDIVAREAVDTYGKDYFRHPVGTGPFVFVSWDPGQALVLRRNPHYWQKDAAGNQLPFLDTLNFTFVKDDNVQFGSFRTGNYEESFNIPTELYTTIIDPETGKPTPQYTQYNVQSAPAMLTWFFDFNTTKQPFDNPDVRRAFNYAVDRTKLAKYVLQGSPYGPAVHGIVPPVFNGYPMDSIIGYTYDPAKAKESLTKAGYPDGKNFPEVTMSIYPEPRLKQVAEAMQEMFRKTLNIEVKIQQMEFPQLMSQSEGNKLQFWGTRWYGDYPDAETYLNLMYGELVPKSDTLPSYPNSTRYNNPEFNALFKQAVQTTDAAARTKLYAKAEQIAIADAPLIPITYERHYKLLQSYVQDFPLDGMARYEQLKYVWLNK